MKNKLCRLCADIVLIIGYLVTLNFVLLGIDVVFDSDPFLNFMVMTVICFYVSLCSTSALINVKKNLSPQSGDIT